jgi:hypothetical protein
VLIVPIIVVFTMFDLFVWNLGLGEKSTGKGKIDLELAEENFKERYGEVFQRSTMITAGEIPYALVTCTFDHKIASSH